MIQLKNGLLITIEGIDGSGKSTLVSGLASKLRTHNMPLIVTREPGNTPLGKKIRSLIQHRDVAICPKAEYLLFAADRAQHFNDLVIPHLNKNKMVLSDRMGDSSIVYQGFGRGLDIDTIKYINNWSMSNIKPDLTLYTRIDPETAFKRILKRNEPLTAFEQEKHRFFKTLSDGFDTLFSTQDNVIVLDGTKSQSTLATQALESIMQWIKKKKIIA